MKSINAYLLLLFINFITSTVLGQIPNQGLFVRSVDGSNGTFEKIWFKDSILIFSPIAHYGQQNSDTVLIQGQYPTKYIYYDLRTHMCYDYYRFATDNFFNFRYNAAVDSLPIAWLFRKDGYDTKGMQMLPDTTLRGIVYKRIMRSYERIIYPEKLETIFYLNNSLPVFRFLQTFSQIEEQFPGYHIQMIEDKYFYPVNLSTFRNYDLARTYLTSQELAIFEHWGKNALDTIVPLSSLSVANSHYNNLPIIPRAVVEKLNLNTEGIRIE